jgi:cytidylate kinase
MIVTIDGPAGTGKSSVARRLAEVLNFEFLDTGAMYRMIALKVIAGGVDPQDQSRVVNILSQTQMDLSGGAYLMDGDPVGTEIRSADVTSTASLVAQIPAVRTELVRRQREMAAGRKIVCEGRDQGTVAFPHAECKFFLTADPKERARRRQLDLQSQGKVVDFDELLREQTARDQRDEERAISPLKPAADAILVDTTAFTEDEVVDVLRRQILSHLASSNRE